jgi:glycerol-3-phosphate O-acyltransferase
VFLFENDNLDEEEILAFSREEIKEIMMVRGKISSVLIPHRHMNSNEKIQSIEDSIDFLKKELYAISKKLNSQKNKN